MVDALQARGRYSEARQVSLLADLPVQRLLLSQVGSMTSAAILMCFVHLTSWTQL